MSRNPPSAVADFFAAFEVASRSMKCPAAPGRAADEVVPPAAEAAVKKPASRTRRRQGLGGTGVDLGDVMVGWPPLRNGSSG
jgi:hypothetical protein